LNCFITTCTISAYHHWRCEFEFHSWRGVLDTALRDKVCQWLAIGRWFFPGTPVSPTIKSDHHDITEILLKKHYRTVYMYMLWYPSISWNIIEQFTCICYGIHQFPETLSNSLHVYVIVPVYVVNNNILNYASSKMKLKKIWQISNFNWGCRGRDHMIVGFITTCTISAYHHWRCEFEFHSWRGVLDTAVVT
jgi:hypothetical protein